MKKREYIIVYMVLMILALVFGGLALRMEYFSSKILPLVMSGFLLFLCAIGITREILAGHRFEAELGQDVTTTKEESGENWSKYAVVGAWVVGFFLAIYLLGFVIAIPLFILFYMKAHGIRWLSALTLSIATGAFAYLVFVVALQLYFYGGLISPYLEVPIIYFR